MILIFRNTLLVHTNKDIAQIQKFPRKFKPLKKHLLIRKVFIRFWVDSQDILLLFFALLFLILYFLLFNFLLFRIFYVVLLDVLEFSSVVFTWIYFLINLAIFSTVEYNSQRMNMWHFLLRHNWMYHFSCLIDVSLIT